MEEDGNGIGAEELAQEERKKAFDKKILALVNRMEETGEEKIIVDGMCIKAEKEGGYSIVFENTEIIFATVSPQSVIEYDIQGIENFKALAKEAEKQGVKVIKFPEGLPEIEYLKKLKEEERQKEKARRIKQENEENNKTEETPEKEKKQDENEIEKNKLNEGIVKEKGSDWIPIGLHGRQADTHKTVHNELEEATGEETPEFYIAPNPRDVTDYKLMAKVDGGYKEIPLRSEEGTNPTHTVTRINNNGVTQEVAVKIIQINDDRIIAIYHGGKTNIQADIANRTDDGRYIGTSIADNQAPNEIENASPEIRDRVGDTRDAQINLDTIHTIYVEIKELEERDIPDKMNPAKDGSGIEVHELDEEGFRRKVEANIEKDLRKENSEATEEFKAKIKEMASQIATKVIDNDENYDQAKEEVQAEYIKNSKEGFGPWSGPRARPRG